MNTPQQSGQGSLDNSFLWNTMIRGQGIGLQAYNGLFLEPASRLAIRIVLQLEP